MSAVYTIDLIFILILTIGYQIFLNDLLSVLNEAINSYHIYNQATVDYYNTPYTSSEYKDAYDNWYSTYYILIAKITIVIPIVIFPCKINF